MYDRTLNAHVSKTIKILSYSIINFNLLTKREQNMPATRFM